MSIRAVALIFRLVSLGLVLGGVIAGVIWLTSGGGVASVGLVITAGVLIFMGLIMFMTTGSLAKAAGPRITNGVQGTAQVTSVRDTGTTINDTVALFQVSAIVTIPGVAPYPTELTLPVGRTQWGQLQPGSVLPVLVDPNDHSKVAYDKNRGMSAAPTAAMPAAGGAVPGSVPVTQLSAADIVDRGVAATGTLVSASPTGLTAGAVNPQLPPDEADDPLVQVTMSWPGGDGLQQSISAMMRVPDGKALPPAGSSLPVRYLPGQSGVAAIDWSLV
jgi:hypothetical protein